MLASSLHCLTLQGDSVAVVLNVTAGRLAVPAAVQWQLQSMTGNADAWLSEAEQTGLLQWDGGAVAYIEVGLTSGCQLCVYLRLQSTYEAWALVASASVLQGLLSCRGAVAEMS